MKRTEKKVRTLKDSFMYKYLPTGKSKKIPFTKECTADARCIF